MVLGFLKLSRFYDFSSGAIIQDNIKKQAPDIRSKAQVFVSLLLANNHQQFWVRTTLEWTHHHWQSNCFEQWGWKFLLPCRCTRWSGYIQIPESLRQAVCPEGSREKFPRQILMPLNADQVTNMCSYSCSWALQSPDWGWVQKSTMFVLIRE